MLLNILPTHAYFHSIYPSIFTSSNCFSCNCPDTPFHWYSCPDNTLLTQTVYNSIHDTIFNANLNFPTYQLNNLVHTIASHPSFKPSPSRLYPYSLHSTLKGLIPIALAQSLDPFDISYSQASQIIIQILLKVSDQLYNNIWISYCSNFAHWKKTHQIPFRINTTSHNFPPPRNHRNRTTHTYSCPCGLADQLHPDSNTCPPLGQASLKYNIWSTMWIKYHTPINHILTIQI